MKTRKQRRRRDAIFLSKSEEMSRFQVGKDALVADTGKWKQYTAHMEGTGTLVTMRETLIAATEDANWALREAFALSLLEHSNIVRMYECYFEETEAGPLFCLVTERTERSLALEIEERKTANQPFEETKLWEILTKLVSALYYAHTLHVYHRDIKPDNIYILENEVKLGNFQSVESQQFLNSESTLAGSPYYLSPELKQAYKQMLHTHTFDSGFDQGKADVYSLGVTVLEAALLGKPEELKRLEGLEDYTRRLSTVVSGYPGLAQCLQWMLAVRPQERASLEQLYQWLVPRQ